MMLLLSLNREEEVYTRCCCRGLMGAVVESVVRTRSCSCSEQENGSKGIGGGVSRWMYYCIGGNGFDL